MLRIVQYAYLFGNENSSGAGLFDRASHPPMFGCSSRNEGSIAGPGTLQGAAMTNSDQHLIWHGMSKKVPIIKGLISVLNKPKPLTIANHQY